MNSLSFKTTFGWITVTNFDKKVISVEFAKKKNKGKSENLVKIKKQIIDFCLGKKKRIEANIEMVGTSLQKKIWKELLKIPYGSTKSYGEIAHKIKTSPRYVGNVCGQNKHVLIVPCHRVVRSDGSLGGFSGLGGIKLKKRLLKLEHHE